MRIRIIAILFLVIFFKEPIQSSENFIVFKVNNNVITKVDVDNEYNYLIALNSNLEKLDKEKLYRLSKDSIIREKIKKDEIEKYNLTINELAINNHMKSISQSLNIEPSDLKNFFKSSKISYDQYKEEVETEFLWQTLIAQIYTSKINVNENQIEKEIKELSNKKEKIIEFKLAELEVSYNNETKNKIIEEVKKSIKDIGFSRTVLKYSISSSALNEGEIGWVNSKSISSNLINIIENLKIGDISDGIVGADTLVFYKMLDKKSNEISKNIDVKLMRQNIINKKKNELLNLYSNSHLSKKKNNILIKVQ